jgi:ketosteroid isomerase-like protein
VTPDENVAIVRRAFDAWNAGDMNALSAVYEDDTIMLPPENWPEPGPFIGRDAVMRQWVHQREIFDADDLEAIGDFITAGDRVLVRFIWHGAGHGPDSNMELSALYTLRGGLVHLTEFFWDHSEALETLGLKG